MTEPSQDIWAFQEKLTRRLSWGAGISILLGLGMFLFRTSFWNGIAFQFLGWALIDLLIALAGGSAARKRKSRLGPEGTAAAGPGEARNLGRILWINTALDVLYMLAGLAVVIFLNENHPLWLGTGIGILLQGAFLFFFDWFHAVQVRKFYSPQINGEEQDPAG
jgi:hypothetical protein